MTVMVREKPVAKVPENGTAELWARLTAKPDDTDAIEALVNGHLPLVRAELARASLAAACGAHPTDIDVAGANWGFDWLPVA